MAATTRGVAPLKFGTTTLTGYIVDGNTRDKNTGHLVIEDEIGDPVTSITKFGLTNEATVEAMAKTGTSYPAAGDVLTYDSVEYAVLSVSIKGTKGDVEKVSFKLWSAPTINFSP